MSNEIKQCPYCGEDILAVAKKCKHCGEWLDKDNKKIPIKIDIKKIGTIFISILVIVLVGFLISSTATSSHINAEDLDSFMTYKSIVPSKPASRELISEYSQTAEYIQQMITQENDLNEFLKKAHSRKDKTKLLHSFLINLGEIKRNDIRIQVDSNTLPETFNLSGIELTLKYNENKVPYYVINKPKTDLIEFRYMDFGGEKKSFLGKYEYDFNPEINYLYIQKKYKKYLTKDYAEYIDCLKQFDTIFKHTTYISQKNSATLIDCIKFTLLFNKFMEKNPTFKEKKGIHYRTFEYDLLEKTVNSYYFDNGKYIDKDVKQALEYYIKNASKDNRYYDCIKENYNMLKTNNFEYTNDYGRNCCRL